MCGGGIEFGGNGGCSEVKSGSNGSLRLAATGGAGDGNGHPGDS